MVVPLGPGKFYGSSLPRPWLYTDVKLNSERVDPPAPVLDSLISWADEAHWSMGGRSRKRLRLQGRIEGNVQKLRKQIENTIKKRDQIVSPIDKVKKGISISGANKPNSGKKHSSDSPPPAPFARKRRLTLLVDEDDDHQNEDEICGGGELNQEEEEMVESRGSGIRVRKGRSLVRKLGDDFDQAATTEGVKEKGDGDFGNKSTQSSGENVAAARARKYWRSEEMESDGGGTRMEEGNGNVNVMMVKRKKKKKTTKDGMSPVSNSPNGPRTSPRLMKKKKGKKEIK
ncbi:hypothetical protein Dimus_009566 [Dionaea muscipula]